MSTPHFSELLRREQQQDQAHSPFVGFMNEVGLASQLRLPFSTHALHYGSALFEGIRAFRQPDGGLAIWLLEEHLDRLFHSIKVAMMRITTTREEMRQLIIDVVSLNDDGHSPSLYIRPLCWFGDGLGVDVSRVETHFAVMTKPWGQYLTPSYNGGIKVYLSFRSRPSRVMADGTAKLSGFYGIWSVPEKMLAKQHGCDEAIYAPGGFLLDGTGQEVMAWDVHGQRLVLDHGSGPSGNILHSTTLRFLTDGLTREHAARFPFQCVGEILFYEMVGLAIVGTASGIVPVTFCREEGGPVSWEAAPHPQALELAEFYQQVVTGNFSEYADLLTKLPAAEEVINRRSIDNKLTDLALVHWRSSDLSRRQQALPLA